MSFRALLVLLCVSTVVIAQVEFPPQPSPSLPESFVPAQLPLENQGKPSAPTSPTLIPARSFGIRLTSSVPQQESVLERTVIDPDSPRSQYANQRPEKTTTSTFPRTASLNVDAPVPFPRPSAQAVPQNDAETTRVARLTRELRRKQRQLDEIQSEIDQLTQDLAAAEQPQILIHIELFETVGDQFASLVRLLSAGGDPNDDDTADHIVVNPEAFRKMFHDLVDCGQLVGLSSPKLVTLAGRAGRIEIGSAEAGHAIAITPAIRDGEWSIAANCEDRRQSRQRDYSMNVACKEGDGIVFQMKLGKQFLIGLIQPEVMTPQTAARIPTATPVRHSATPLLPIPAWTSETPNEVREVQWLDLHLDRAPVLR